MLANPGKKPDVVVDVHRVEVVLSVPEKRCGLVLRTLQGVDAFVPLSGADLLGIGAAIQALPPGIVATWTKPAMTPMDG